MSTGVEIRLIDDVEPEQVYADELGDLRRQGRALARWDFYAAPFRVELSDALRERVRPA